MRHYPPTSAPAAELSRVRRGACACAQSYAEAIRIAEERESKVSAQFDKYDLDGSKTIDLTELMSLLEELGLLKNVSDTEDFAQQIFYKFDENDDGVIDFDEFKKLYNWCIETQSGRKGVAAKTASALPQGTLAAREELKRKKAEAKAAEAERIRQQNKAMREKIAAQGKGKDAKALDAECEQMRKEAALKRKQAKEAEQAK